MSTVPPCARRGDTVQLLMTSSEPSMVTRRPSVVMLEASIRSLDASRDMALWEERMVELMKLARQRSMERAMRELLRWHPRKARSEYDAETPKRDPNTVELRRVTFEREMYSPIVPSRTSTPSAMTRQSTRTSPRLQWTRRRPERSWTPPSRYGPVRSRELWGVPQ